jgi:hypothetical protein
MFDTDLDGLVTLEEWINGFLVADLGRDRSLSIYDFGFFLDVVAPQICWNHSEHFEEEKSKS